MKVRLTEKGKRVVESLEIPEMVRSIFYSIFNDPNEYRIYYKDMNEFMERIHDCGFGC